MVPAEGLIHISSCRRGNVLVLVEGIFCGTNLFVHAAGLIHISSFRRGSILFACRRACSRDWGGGGGISYLCQIFLFCYAFEIKNTSKNKMTQIDRTGFLFYFYVSCTK